MNEKVVASRVFTVRLSRLGKLGIGRVRRPTVLGAIGIDGVDRVRHSGGISCEIARGIWEARIIGYFSWLVLYG